ncbi:MAG: hypothetical protein ACE5E6_07710, partial [Phycisphaerae bacterium]
MSNGHDNHRWMQGAAAALMLVSGAWAFEAPPGDTCAQADAITGVGVFPFDSTGATSDGPTHDACALGGGADIAADVWFCWTSPGDGAVTLDTCSGTTVDTKIAVYDGCACPPGDANLLTCGDDACVYQTRVTFDAVAGGQYLVRLGAHPGLGGGEGVFTITLGDVAEPACTAVGAACQPRTLWNAYNSAR